jgi:hypothetical protein
MRYLLLLLLMIPLHAQEGDFNLEAYIFGKSHHTNKEVGYRETNPGLGLGMAWSAMDDVDIIATVGAYKDSYSDNARFAMLGFRLVAGDRDGVHGSLGVSAGHMKGSSFNGFGVLPVISIGYNMIDICATADWIGVEPDRTAYYADGSINKYSSVTKSVAFFAKITLLTF